MVASTRSLSWMAGFRAWVRRRACPVDRSATKTSAGEVSDTTVKAARSAPGSKRTPVMSPWGRPVRRTGARVCASSMVSSVEASALTAVTR
ncbi:hypothetical protein D3C86_1693120 [compost metagenome]